MWSRFSQLSEAFQDIAGSPAEAAAPVVSGSPTLASSPVVSGSPTLASAPVVSGSPTLASAPVVSGSPTLASAPVVSGSPTNVEFITSGGAPPGGITMATLTQLSSRIDAEMIRICGNTQSITEQAKCNQLSLLKFDIQELVRKIEKGELTLSTIPFTFEEANSFLTNMDKGIVGDLFTPNNSSSPSVTNNAPVLTNGSNTQDLFTSINNMKWNMEMSHDPTFSQQTELLDRLEKLESRIMSYMITDTKLPAEVKTLFESELKLIAAILNQHACKPTAQPPDGARCPPTQSSRTGGSDICITESDRYHSSSNNSGDYSATSTHNETRWNRCFFDGVPKTNPDVYLRPGYEANDNHIKSRASRAAFDDSLVGGLNYRERALALCKQIGNTGLGDPADFGCIANPNEVSTTYSWKGNFKMVCSRLGNTWGGFYPEMMGCLPSDPQERYSGALL